MTVRSHAFDITCPCVQCREHAAEQRGRDDERSRILFVIATQSRQAFNFWILPAEAIAQIHGDPPIDAMHERLKAEEG